MNTPTSAHGKMAADDICAMNRKIADDAGLTREKLFGRLNDLVDAKTSKEITVKTGEFDESQLKEGTKAVFVGEKYTNVRDGFACDVVISVEKEDNTTRLRAVDLALQARGEMPSNKMEHRGSVTVLVVPEIKKPDDAGISRNGSQRD